MTHSPEQKAALAAMADKAKSDRAEARARPFRFEDLAGKPEPESWGPLYPKTASAPVTKWRTIANGRELTADEKREYGAAVGTWIRSLNNPGAKRWQVPSTDLNYSKLFTCESIRAKLKAKFAADAARDRREWAMGKLKDSAGHTIAQAYELAMVAKRNRLSARARGLAAIEAALFGALTFAEAA